MQDLKAQGKHIEKTILATTSILVISCELSRSLFTFLEDWVLMAMKFHHSMATVFGHIAPSPPRGVFSSAGQTHDGVHGPLTLRWPLRIITMRPAARKDDTRDETSQMVPVPFGCGHHGSFWRFSYEGLEAKDMIHVVFMSCRLNLARGIVERESREQVYMFLKWSGHYRVRPRALTNCRQSQVLAVLDGLFNPHLQRPKWGSGQVLVCSCVLASDPLK